MNTVDAIARRTAEQAIKEGLQQMAAIFATDANWLRAAAPHFVGALVGKKEAPKFTADQIAKAFEAAIQGHKYNTPPKPADVAALARELCPLPALQKAHTDPTPRRRWTAEERAANIARVEAITAKLDELELDPEYERIKREHGHGSPELEEIHARHREEFQRWVRQA